MNTFKKEERLCSKLIIDKLFLSGSSFLLYPFKIQILNLGNSVESPYKIQVMVIVPKKRFKKAVDRNLLKRRIRELYRIHKQALYETLPSNQDNFAIAFSYVGNQIHDYGMMEAKFLKLIHKLAQRFSPDETAS